MFADTLVTFKAACPAGKAWLGGKCVCEAGRTLSWVSATGVPLANPTGACLACSLGMTSTPKADNTHTCEYCPRGTVSFIGGATGDDTVTALEAAGKMDPLTVCTGACAAGKFAPEKQVRGDTHTVYCESCPKGTYQPGTGNVGVRSCIACGKGEFRKSNAKVGSVERAKTCVATCAAPAGPAYYGMYGVDTAADTRALPNFATMNRCVMMQCEEPTPIKDPITNMCVATCTYDAACKNAAPGVGTAGKTCVGKGLTEGFEYGVTTATAGVSTANTIVSHGHVLKNDRTVRYAPGPGGGAIAELKVGLIYTVTGVTADTFTLKLGDIVVPIAKQAASGAVFAYAPPFSSNARICVSKACGTNKRANVVKDERSCVDCDAGFGQYQETKAPPLMGFIQIDNHGYNTDDAVQYHANGFTGITGLTDGATYYVEKGNDGNKFRLSFTPTYSEGALVGGAKIIVTTGGAKGNQFTVSPSNANFVYGAAGLGAQEGLRNGDNDAKKVMGVSVKADFSQKVGFCQVSRCNPVEYVAGHRCKLCPAGKVSTCTATILASDTNIPGASANLDTRDIFKYRARYLDTRGLKQDWAQMISLFGAMSTNTWARSTCDHTGMADTTCTPVVCPVNYYVVGNECTKCPAFTTHVGGMFASDADSPKLAGVANEYCRHQECATDYFKPAGGGCEACAAGKYIAAGEDAIDGTGTCASKTCDATKPGVNPYTRACEACSAGLRMNAKVTSAGVVDFFMTSEKGEVIFEADHGFKAKDAVWYTDGDGTSITGLTTGTMYYVVIGPNSGTKQFGLAATYDAVADVIGYAIAITGGSSGNHFTKFQKTDAAADVTVASWAGCMPKTDLCAAGQYLKADRTCGTCVSGTSVHAFSTFPIKSNAIHTCDATVSLVNEQYFVEGDRVVYKQGTAPFPIAELTEGQEYKVTLKTAACDPAQCFQLSLITGVTKAIAITDPLMLDGVTPSKATGHIFLLKSTMHAEYHTKASVGLEQRTVPKNAEGTHAEFKALTIKMGENFWSSRFQTWMLSNNQAVTYNQAKGPAIAGLTSGTTYYAKWVGDGKTSPPTQFTLSATLDANGIAEGSIKYDGSVALPKNAGIGNSFSVEKGACKALTCQCNFKSAGGVCTACAAGKTAAAGAVTTTASTCTAISCRANERLHGNRCIKCALGKKSAGGSVTSCDIIQCGVSSEVTKITNYMSGGKVEDGACVPCTRGTKHVSASSSSHPAWVAAAATVYTLTVPFDTNFAGKSPVGTPVGQATSGAAGTLVVALDGMSANVVVSSTNGIAFIATTAGHEITVVGTTPTNLIPSKVDKAKAVVGSLTDDLNGDGTTGVNVVTGEVTHKNAANKECPNMACLENQYVKSGVGVDFCEWCVPGKVTAFDVAGGDGKSGVAGIADISKGVPSPKAVGPAFKTSGTGCVAGTPCEAGSAWAVADGAFPAWTAAIGGTYVLESDYSVAESIAAGLSSSSMSLRKNGVKKRVCTTCPRGTRTATNDALEGLDMSAARCTETLKCPPNSYLDTDFSCKKCRTGTFKAGDTLSTFVGPLGSSQCKGACLVNEYLARAKIDGVADSYHCVKCAPGKSRPAGDIIVLAGEKVAAGGAPPVHGTAQAPKSATSCADVYCPDNTVRDASGNCCACAVGTTRNLANSKAADLAAYEALQLATTLNSAQTCTATSCAQGYYNDGVPTEPTTPTTGSCKACAAGKTNVAGDDASSTTAGVCHDTTCGKIGNVFHGFNLASKTCVVCEAWETAPEATVVATATANVACTPLSCRINQKVDADADHKCVNCNTWESAIVSTRAVPTSCAVKSCAVNEWVESDSPDKICKPCVPGTSSVATLRTDTTKQAVCVKSTSNSRMQGIGGFAKCLADFHVVNYACVACATGTNAAGDDPNLPMNTECDAAVVPVVQKHGPLCGANERVVNHACTACPVGTKNDAGDDPHYYDTACTAEICKENFKVSCTVVNSKTVCTCAPCNVPAAGPHTHGSTNAAGDDCSLGVSTMCNGGGSILQPLK